MGGRVIDLVVGLPRSGKGLFLIKRLVETLLHSNQVVVTNFAVDIPRLHEWIQKTTGRAIDVPGRIFLLRDEQVKEYFLYRGTCMVSRTESVLQERGVFLDFSGVVDSETGQFRDGCFPVHYILDEVDLCFPAREFAKNGKEFNFYNKQHGKLGDTVTFCCQDPSQLDKLIRVSVQFTVWMKNLGKIKAGFFRMPKKISWAQYLQCPKNRQNETELDSGWFSIESMKGLQDCFRTQDGLGVRGVVDADKRDRIKGISVWWISVPFFLVIGAIWFAPSMARAAWGKEKKVKANTSQVSVPGTVSARGVGNGRSVPVTNVVVITNVVGAAIGGTNKVYYVGYARVPGRGLVYLSDGRVLDEGACAVISDRFVIVGREIFERRPFGSLR